MRENDATKDFACQDERKQAALFDDKQTTPPHLSRSHQSKLASEQAVASCKHQHDDTNLFYF